MREWSETEVFSFLADHLGEAASDCEALAVNRKRGPTYHRLRVNLKKIEDMCRIVHYMRQDFRWLEHGHRCEACHKAAGDWLRGVPSIPGPDGQVRPAMAIPEGVKHPLFMKLSQYLKNMAVEIETLRHARTGRNGMILPRMLEPPSVRQPTNYPVKLPSGLIVPRRTKVA